MTSPILLLAGRFLLASALLMALYWVVWRKQATYRAKRMYLLTMPFVALAISLLQVEVYKPEPVVVEVIGPSGPSPIPSQGRGVDTAPIMNSPIENKANSAALSEGQNISLPPLGEGKGWSPWGPWGLGLCLLYALIILLFCIPFVVNLVLVRRLRKEASIAEEEKEADIHILTGEGVQAPFSFHRTIFLPTNLTEAQRRMILAHEQAHILHRHYVDVWVAEAITRLLWWNPFLWWARQELRNVHEFEADSNVLATGEDVYAYQAILIEEVLHGDIVIANGFNHSFIRRRFVEMLQSTNRRMTSMAKAGTAAWMLLVVALMCCTVGEAETVYKVKEQSHLSSLPQGEGVDSHAISEQQDITLPSPAKEEKEVPTTAFKTPIDTTFTTQVLFTEEIVIDTAYTAQNEALMHFIAEWFELSENSVHLSESGFDEKYKDFPKDFTYEDYNKGWNGTIILQINFMSKWLNKLNGELRPQVEALLKQHGWVIPRDKEFLITIESKAFNKTWTFVKKPRSSQILPSATFTEKELTQMKIAARREKDNEVWKQIQRCFYSWAMRYSSMGVSMEEYEMAKKVKPDLPKIAEVSQNKELRWTVKQLYIEHRLKYVDEKIANQVREAIKLHSTDDYLEREIFITIDLGEQNGYFKKEKGTEQFYMILLPKENPLPEEFLPTEKVQAATDTSANESAITNDASLREQDEALQAFFRGWFDMNKSSQEPMLTEEEFQQAIKTEPIPPGFDPSYKAYKERTKNFIAEAKKKMEDGRARLNKEIRPQVEAVLKQLGMQFPPERQLKIIIRAAYKNATWEFMNSPNAYGCAVNTNFLIVDDPSSPDYNEKKDFISPQWGLELPEGYVRLTDYKKLAETDATAKAQYNQLMSCFRNAQALRKEALTNAYKEKHPRYVSVEEATMAGIKKLFRNAGIEMLEKGAYRLPDGTIVMEDDQHNLVPQSVDYQQGTTDRDPRLCNKAPRMERDKSPNYSPFNEQTWPVYTNVQTVPTNEYTPEPQVFRGKDCTYVVEHFHIVYNFHWFYISPSSKLVDTKTNDQYVKRYTEHFHSNNYVWIHGMEGKVIRLIVVFPPLPKNVTAVDYIPGRIPADERLSNALPYKEYKKLKVQELDESKGMKVVY